MELEIRNFLVDVGVVKNKSFVYVKMSCCLGKILEFPHFFVGPPVCGGGMEKEATL